MAGRVPHSSLYTTRVNVSVQNTTADSDPAGLPYPSEEPYSPPDATANGSGGTASPPPPPAPAYTGQSSSASFLYRDVNGAPLLHIDAETGSVGVGRLAESGPRLVLDGELRAELFAVPGCDFAEWERLSPECPDPFVPPGTVVGFDETGLVTTVFAAARTFGVVSTSPGLLAGSSPGLGGVVVAYAGKVPVLIPGTCRAGEAVYASAGADGRVVASTTPTAARFLVGRIRTVLGVGDGASYALVVVSTA